MTQPPEQRWRARPVLAGMVRTALLLVPLAASGLAVLVVDRVAPADPDPAWLWLAAAMSAAVLTGVVVERAVRRLTPLPILLRLDLLFPGTAPSRYRVARDAVTRSQERLERTPSGTAEQVMRLIAALGAHDRRTRGHCERVRVLTDLLAVEMRLGAADRDRLRWAALLHDLGKLDVPTGVLNKPSRLTAGEFDAVKAHPAVGAALAAPLLPWLGEWGLGIVEHHEKYDGSGYPAGLAGSGISRAGRMVGLVDAFETMTAARTYKKAMATAAARTELALCSGTHFDPVCVRAFLSVPLPRLLWAMGPVSFAMQVPFLRMLAEAGRLGASAGAAAGPTAAGVAGAAAIAVTGLGGLPTGLPPAGVGGASESLALGVGAGVAAPAELAVPLAAVRAVSAEVPMLPVTVPLVVGPPTGMEPLPVELGPVELGPAPAAPVATGPVVVGPPTGIEPLPEPLAVGPVSVGPVAVGPVVVGPPTGVDPLPEPLDPVEVDPVAIDPVVVDPVVVGPVVVGPLVPGATSPVVEPVVGILDPVVDPVVDPVLHAVDPVLDPVLTPVVETVDPVLDAVGPVLGILDPVVDTVDTALPLEPVVETVAEPVIGILDPVVGTVTGTLPLGGLLGG